MTYSYTHDARGNLRYRARTTTATIALIASGYLVMSGTTAESKDLVRSGTTAESAAGQSSSEAGKGFWLGDLWAQVWPSTDNTADTRGNVDRKGSGNADRKESGKVDRKGKGDLFLPGPEYDKKYDAKGNVDIYGAKTAVEPPGARGFGFAARITPSAFICRRTRLRCFGASRDHTPDSNALRAPRTARSTSPTASSCYSTSSRAGPLPGVTTAADSTPMTISTWGMRSRSSLR